MIIKKSFLVLVSSLYCLANTSVSIANPNEFSNIKDQMLESGFENIQVIKSEDKNDLIDSYKITFENRTFLYEIHAIGHLLKKLKPIIKPNSHLEIYPQSEGKIVSRLSFYYQDYLDFINNNLTEEEFSKKVDIYFNPKDPFEKKDNALFSHSDLTFSGAYIFDQTLGPILLFSPYFTTYLGNGFSFNTRYRTVFYNVENGFDFAKNTKLVEPSFQFTTFDYKTPVIDNIPLYTTFKVGHNYYGNHSFILGNDTQYLLFDGIMTFNLSSGIVLNLENNNSKVSTDFSLTPYGQIYLSKYDLVFEGGGGKFLGDNYGIWGRATRQLNNADVGFSLYKILKTSSTDPNTTQFNFEYTIYFGNAESIKASPFRVTSARTFSGNLFAGRGNIGQVSRTTNSIYLKRLFPEYLKSHLYYWKE